MKLLIVKRKLGSVSNVVIFGQHLAPRVNVGMNLSYLVQNCRSPSVFQSLNVISILVGILSLSLRMYLYYISHSLYGSFLKYHPFFYKERMLRAKMVHKN